MNPSLKLGLLSSVLIIEKFLHLQCFHFVSGLALSLIAIGSFLYLSQAHVCSRVQVCGCAVGVVGCVVIGVVELSGFHFRFDTYLHLVLYVPWWCSCVEKYIL